MTRAEALSSVRDRLDALTPPGDGDSWVVFPDQTLECPFGWVVFWGSRLFAETGDARFAVAGNAPFIFDRDSGALVETGTALPVEHYIAEYESRRAQPRT
jgi:hypothetical protein